ncbi:MAG: TetR/AcrR family transcriptional regulator [Treponema sp.]|nr:TetR/AcrR family transcriptional regulator [Treponema sp.]
MAVPVEHDKRKHEILDKALTLFIEEGYEDVTFQKIADRCGITRTTLYIYFKNKREIFSWSIKQLTNDMEKELLVVVQDKTLTTEACLRKLFQVMLAFCESRAKLFQVLMAYLLQLQKTQVSVNERVHRRFLRLHHLITGVIIKGQKSGDFKALPIKKVEDMLYMILENAVFHIVVLGKTNLDDMQEIANFTIDQICMEKGKE